MSSVDWNLSDRQSAAITDLVSQIANVTAPAASEDIKSDKREKASTGVRTMTMDELCTAYNLIDDLPSAPIFEHILSAPAAAATAATTTPAIATPAASTASVSPLSSLSVSSLAPRPTHN